MLKIKDMYKVFNANTINENKVFEEFSLDVEKGEYVSIIGSNGAGKSTLLNLISGNLAVDSGSIIIDGEEVAKKEEYYRCRYIGRVFQNPTVGVAPNMNILENMSLADNKGKPYGMKFAIDKKRINYYKEELKKLNLGLEDKLYNKVNLLSFFSITSNLCLSIKLFNSSLNTSGFFKLSTISIILFLASSILFLLINASISNNP